MSKLWGALVGCGYFANLQMEAWNRLRDEAEIAAVCDLQLEKAQDFGRRYGIGSVYCNFEEMLDRAGRLDFIDIVTRSETHWPLVRMAAQRKLHILCQKPLAPSMQEAKEMVSFCAQKGVRLMVNENWRWQAWYREIQSLLEGGAIGNPFFFYFNHRDNDGLLDPPYPRQPYFVSMPRFLIYETLVHYLDTVRFLIGEIESIFCQIKRINPKIAGEDAAVIQLTCGKTTGIIDGNRCSTPDEPGPVLGYARFEGNQGKLLLSGTGRIFLEPTLGTRKEHEYAIPSSGYRGDSCLATQRHFVRCLQSGEEFEASGSDYLRTLHAVFRAYESAESGRVVLLDEEWRVP